MGRPRKAKTQPQPEKQQQTLLFIKPKPPEEPIAEPATRPKLQKLPDIEVKPATIEPTEIPTEQQEALASSSMFQAVGVIALRLK